MAHNDIFINNYTRYMIKILKEKRLNHLVDPYVELSEHLKQTEYAFLKRNIKKKKPQEFEELIIDKLDKYKITYKEAKKRERKKEDKDKVAERQKKFVEKQKVQNKKKIQVYVQEHTYELLQRMSEKRKLTYTEIITVSLECKARTWDK